MGTASSCFPSLSASSSPPITVSERPPPCRHGGHHEWSTCMRVFDTEDPLPPPPPKKKSLDKGSIFIALKFVLQGLCVGTCCGLLRLRLQLCLVTFWSSPPLSPAPERGWASRGFEHPETGFPDKLDTGQILDIYNLLALQLRGGGWSAAMDAALCQGPVLQHPPLALPLRHDGDRHQVLHRNGVRAAAA